MPAIARYILMGSWAVFWLYWFVSWFDVKPTVERESAGSRLIVIFALGMGIFFLFFSKKSRLLPLTDMLAWTSIVFSLAGMAITLWARRTLAGNWSADVTLKEGHELIQHGPYRFVRHPIYTGFLSMTLAAAIAFGYTGGFLGVGLVALGFWYKLRKEEALMTRHFPAAYPAYKARVKALIPWVL